jgi:hypothetical protein
MERAGLRDLQIKPVQEEVVFQSALQRWDWVTHSHPVGAGLVANMTEAQVPGVRKVLDNMLRKRVGDSGAFILTNATHSGIGIK